MLITLSHSDDSHVNATAPCMSCGTRMHFTQPVSCNPLVIHQYQVLDVGDCHIRHVLDWGDSTVHQDWGDGYNKV